MTQQSENEQIEQLRREIHRLREQVDFLMSRPRQIVVTTQEEIDVLLESRRKNLEKQFKIW